MEEEISKDENKEQLEDIKKVNRKFVIKFIIFLIILIIVTISAIYFSIKYLSKNDNKENSSTVIDNEIRTEEVGKVPEDSKFGIKSYTETYDTNSIKIVEYYDLEGNVVTEEKYDGHEYKTRIQYIQIYGLKNGSIQNKINERLKKQAYDLNCNFVYTMIQANFSNILSVEYFGDNSKVATLNINLATGEYIKFEDIFVSSATINSHLIEGLYETLAWESLEVDEEGNYKNNMDDVDTSEYEDKFLMLINNYNKSKNNLKFSITPSSINVYGLLDKRILDSEYIDKISIKINLIEHMNEVAIYKRFLTSESIFENDSLGTKNMVVLTGNAMEDRIMNRLSYGKITDNIFIEEVLMESFKKDEWYENCKKYIEKLAKEQQDLLKSQTPNNIGRFYQREFNVFYDEEKQYYIINSTIYQAICPISYFKSNAFKDFIYLNNMPRANVGLFGFTEYMKEDFPNLEIMDTEYKDYYISRSGEFLGNTKEETETKNVEVVQ